MPARPDQQGLRADRSNQLWVSDLTYVSSWLGWLCVAFVIDGWASWLNRHWLLGPIGYIPPAEAEANYSWHLASQISMAKV
jgi:transposase InsO family protein